MFEDVKKHYTRVSRAFFRDINNLLPALKLELKMSNAMQFASLENFLLILVIDSRPLWKRISGADPPSSLSLSFYNSDFTALSPLICRSLSA